MLSPLRVLALSAVALTLTACYWPQNYKLNMHVARDGTVKVSYKGQLVNLQSRLTRLDAEAKGHTLSAKDKAQLEAVNKSVLTEFKKSKTVKSAQYLGNDTYAIAIESSEKLKDGKEFKPLMNLMVIRKVGKKIFIKSQALKDKDVKQLRALKLTAKGEISITTDAKVLSHNAQASGILGKTYRWKMDKLGATAPAMTLTLP